MPWHTSEENQASGGDGRLHNLLSVWLVRRESRSTPRVRERILCFAPPTLWWTDRVGNPATTAAHVRFGPLSNMRVGAKMNESSECP